MNLLDRYRFRWNAILGNFDSGSPCDGIEDQGAPIVASPSFMVVPAGGSEPAALSVGTLIGPTNVLNFSGCHGLSDVGIVGVRTVFAIHGAFRRMSRDDRGDSLHVRLKAHVVVPLVFLGEWFDSAGDSVLGERFDLGSPVGVDRPMSLEVTTHGFEHEVTGASNWYFHGIVHENESDTGIDELFELVKVLHDEVSFAAIAENDYAVGSVEGFGVSRPSFVQGGFETEFALFESVGKELVAALMGMGLGVFTSIGKEDDFLVRGKGERRKGQGGKYGEEESA